MCPELLVLLVLIFGVRVVNVSFLAVGTPVVTFTPKWNTVFIGENIRLTCEIMNEQHYLSPSDNPYIWYKDNKTLEHREQSFVILSLEITDSGNYQCKQTDSYSTSDPASLQVSNGWVILQAPLYIYEGEDITLTCAHYPGYSARKTIFYKENAVIRKKEKLLIRNTSLERSGRYKCTKEVYHHLAYYQYSGEASVSVKEIFTPPKIETSPHAVLEDEPVTVTCSTTLSPPKLEKKSQFAFYRNGQNVQQFSPSSYYEIQSFKLEDSGNYYCLAKVDEIIKRSEIFYIEANKWITDPYIWLFSHPMIEGDPMYMTCDVRRSSWDVELYFTFYKDGQNLQNFSKSDKYNVAFTKEKDSGNYSCEVEMPSKNLTKQSKEHYVHIQGPNIENSAFNQKISWLVLPGCTLVSLLSFITLYV